MFQVNPLLELFGNATTPLNENSSRFCKFIELQYAGEGQLRNGESSYHFFLKLHVKNKMTKIDFEKLIIGNLTILNKSWYWIDSFAFIF